MAHAEGQHHPAAGQHAPAAGGQHHVEGQQHPLGIYFKIWGLLFVLSTLSYLVDYFHFQGYLRWTLIVVFMLLKAGLIVAVFMHMLWERLAMVYAILLPPLLLLVLLWIGAGEADHTFFTRGTFFGAASAAPAAPAVPVQHPQAVKK
jgi:cytochrome c oxidase subunit 4